jgi:predicted metal-dependent HD superfamily phosphohydrolase
MLRDHFSTLLLQYNSNSILVNKLWEEIMGCYQAKNRYYHNLGHLQQILEQVLLLRDKIQDWDAILFALFYHDIIYNPRKSDNEEKSAALAIKRMQELAIPETVIENCRLHILATKQHAEAPFGDSNIFTDADLSILGTSWNVYSSYFKNIRKEYALYPNILYKPGRKKVLNHFLNMKYIFKTVHFRDAYEWQAKQNLQKELSQYT